MTKCKKSLTGTETTDSTNTFNIKITPEKQWQSVTDKKNLVYIFTFAILTSRSCLVIPVQQNNVYQGNLCPKALQANFNFT